MATPELPARCDDCTQGDHSWHRADLGGICVGCPCPEAGDQR